MQICLFRTENPDNTNSWNYIPIAPIAIGGIQQQAPPFSFLNNNISGRTGVYLRSVSFQKIKPILLNTKSNINWTCQ